MKLTCSVIEALVRNKYFNGKIAPAMIPAVLNTTGLWDTEIVLWYCKMTGKRLPEAEPKLTKSGVAAYCYARDTIHGAFPEGEKAIAMSGRVSTKYAMEVLKGRFHAGEFQIFLEGGKNASEYAHEILKITDQDHSKFFLGLAHLFPRRFHYHETPKTYKECYDYIVGKYGEGIYP